jgi:hypothetical protein
MANYFYFDQTNQKHGPIDEQRLRELAVAGIIKPNTPMETVDGHKGTAKQIPGLQFTTSATSSSTVPEWYAMVAIICCIVCVALTLVVLGADQYAHQLLAQVNSDAQEVTTEEVSGYFRLSNRGSKLLTIVFVAGMFFGCRGMSTNKAKISQIGVILCIIAFVIPLLYWTWRFGL